MPIDTQEPINNNRVFLPVYAKVKIKVSFPPAAKKNNILALLHMHEKQLKSCMYHKKIHSLHVTSLFSDSEVNSSISPAS